MNEQAQKEAKELIEQFCYESNRGICEDTGIDGINYEMAKQCAIIAQQCVIDELNYLCEIVFNGDLIDELSKANEVLTALKQM